MRDELEKVEAGVEFYDPEKICAAAPVRDNLLFGRVSYRVANAQARVAEAISAAVRELGLLEDIERVGLDRQVGTAGRLLTAQERASVNLVRCLVKRPDILVIDGALAPFDEGRAQKMIKLLIELGRGKSLFMVLPNDRQAQDFDILMRFGDGKITTESNAGRRRGNRTSITERPANGRRGCMTLEAEVQTLRQVPMFKDIDPARLKLLAFTSERVQFADRQRFFSQGDASDSAYVILEGRADVLLTTPTGEIKVAELESNALVGEMGILSDTPRSATIMASQPTTALRIDRRVFLELLAQFPQMALAVMRELAKRLEQTNAKLVAKSGA